nr:hypothetical protein CFP56_62768 [Quercus suber]
MPPPGLLVLCGKDCVRDGMSRGGRGGEERGSCGGGGPWSVDQQMDKVTSSSSEGDGDRKWSRCGMGQARTVRGRTRRSRQVEHWILMLLAYRGIVAGEWRPKTIEPCGWRPASLRPVYDYGLRRASMLQSAWRLGVSCLDAFAFHDDAEGHDSRAIMALPDAKLPANPQLLYLFIIGHCGISGEGEPGRVR